MDGYNIIGILLMMLIAILGLFMFIVPSKCVKKEDSNNTSKIKQAKRNGLVIAILGIVAIILIIAL